MSLTLGTGLRNILLNGTQGFAKLLEDGCISVYTGTKPANADAAETGTLLLRISTASTGTMGSGGTGGGTCGTYGLNFGTAANGALPKNAEVWSGTGIANGESGWFRFYEQNILMGASSTNIRMDGVCAVSGGDLNMSDLTVATEATIIIDSFTITLPAY